jgi:hypothetical protein
VQPLRDSISQLQRANELMQKKLLLVSAARDKAEAGLAAADDGRARAHLEQTNSAHVQQRKWCNTFSSSLSCSCFHVHARVLLFIVMFSFLECVCVSGLTLRALSYDEDSKRFLFLFKHVVSN